jgi:hypothetical protein
MVTTFREDDRSALLFKGTEHIMEDEVVALRISRQGGIELLNSVSPPV